MSTTTGGHLNLVKPGTDDEIATTVGVDIPANMQTIDDHVTAHTTDQNAHQIKNQTTNVMYYLRYDDSGLYLQEV